LNHDESFSEAFQPRVPEDVVAIDLERLIWNERTGPEG
jgi:hypothetical protein